MLLWEQWFSTSLERFGCFTCLGAKELEEVNLGRRFSGAQGGTRLIQRLPPGRRRVGLVVHGSVVEMSLGNAEI